MLPQLPEFIVSLGFAGIGIGGGGALFLKVAGPFIGMLRSQKSSAGNGEGNYAKGRDVGVLISAMERQGATTERQTVALRELTAEIHGLADANREVLTAFRASLP